MFYSSKTPKVSAAIEMQETKRLNLKHVFCAKTDVDEKYYTFTMDKFLLHSEEMQFKERIEHITFTGSKDIRAEFWEKFGNFLEKCTNLKTLYIKDTTFFNWEFKSDPLKLALCKVSVKLEGLHFIRCSGVRIKDDWPSIMKRFTELKEITITENLAYMISDHLIENCKNLTYFAIDNNANSVGSDRATYENIDDQIKAVIKAHGHSLRTIKFMGISIWFGCCQLFKLLNDYVPNLNNLNIAFERAIFKFSSIYYLQLKDLNILKIRLEQYESPYEILSAMTDFDGLKELSIEQVVELAPKYKTPYKYELYSLHLPNLERIKWRSEIPTDFITMLITQQMPQLREMLLFFNEPFDTSAGINSDELVKLIKAKKTLTSLSICYWDEYSNTRKCVPFTLVLKIIDMLKMNCRPQLKLKLPIDIGEKEVRT